MRSVVLVHGLMGTVTAHYERCRELWTHPVVEVGLPGHGLDEQLPEHPARAAVRRVHDAILAQPEPPVVVGLSYLGAAVALRAAESVAESVHGVVISGYSLIVSPKTLRLWLAGFTRMAAEQHRTREYLAGLHGPEWERLLASTVAELDDGCLILPQQQDIESLGTPVLLINGALLENERLAVQPAVEAGADVAIVGGAGHLVPQDSPRAFVAGVEEFLDRVSERRTVFHERRRVAERAASARPVPAGRDGV
ncbi:alpha/beta fold hydrolase [Nonomuraea sp. NPDC047897]|uniref:alpha/beta fold hydrolase n=1 Tax=Nonomuraea sp. NPDC047897 TaxID=3364346 RepID=UPI003717DCA0